MYIRSSSKFLHGMVQFDEKPKNEGEIVGTTKNFTISNIVIIVATTDSNILFIY